MGYIDNQNHFHPKVVSPQLFHSPCSIWAEPGGLFRVVIPHLPWCCSPRPIDLNLVLIWLSSIWSTSGVTSPLLLSWESKRNLVYKYTNQAGKKPDLRLGKNSTYLSSNRRLWESSHLSPFSPLDPPCAHVAVETKWSGSSGRRRWSRPGELVYGPLVPLEASDLVNGPIRVDPGWPGRKKDPDMKSCCSFRSESISWSPANTRSFEMFGDNIKETMAKLMQSAERGLGCLKNLHPWGYRQHAKWKEHVEELEGVLADSLDLAATAITVLSLMPLSTLAPNRPCQWSLQPPPRPFAPWWTCWRNICCASTSPMTWSSGLEEEARHLLLHVMRQPLGQAIGQA